MVLRKRNKKSSRKEHQNKDEESDVTGDVLGKDWTKKVEEAKDSLDEEKLRRSSSDENLAGKSSLITDES